MRYTFAAGPVDAVAGLLSYSGCICADSLLHESTLSKSACGNRAKARACTTYNFTLMPSTPFKYSNRVNVKQPRYVEPCCAVAELHSSINNTTKEDKARLMALITPIAPQTVLLLMLSCKAGLIAHAATAYA
jgi:hypothetical protein